MSEQSDLLERLNECLALGGFWNPESMDSLEMSRLLTDCRDFLVEYAAAVGAEQRPVAEEIRTRVAEFFETAAMQNQEEENVQFFIDCAENIREAPLNLFAAQPVQPQDMVMVPMSLIDKLEVYGTPEHPLGVTLAVFGVAGRFETARAAIENAMIAASAEKQQG